MEQPEKFALREHHRLPELIGGQLDDIVLDAVVRLFGVKGRAVRHGEDSTCSLRRHAVAALLSALIGRIPADRIDHAAAFKGQADIGLRILIGILRAHHICLAVLAAEVAVERKGDRVKDRGLARAGIAGHEEQSGCAECGKVDIAAAGVGAECLHFQCQRSHAFPSSAQISLMRSRMVSACESDISLPFISRKNPVNIVSGSSRTDSTVFSAI